MLGGLIRAQILENLYGIKFIVTFIVCLILVIAGTISGIGKYQGQLRDQADIINTNEASLMESGSWRSAARLGQKVVKPATRLVLFSAGLEESVGRTATVKEGDFLRWKTASTQLHQFLQSLEILILLSSSK